MSNTENRRSGSSGDATMAALVAGLAGALILTGVAIHREMDNRSGPSSSLQFADFMGLASAVIGVAVLMWWSAALLIALIGQLLTLRGHVVLGRRVSACSPGFMRRLALLLLSLNLMATPAIASVPDQDTAAVQTLKKHAAGVEQAVQDEFITPAPTWQATAHSQVGATAADAGPQWTPTKSATTDNIVTRRPARSTDVQPQNQNVTVRSGDSLWSLCAEHLGPYATDVEIATEWPRWYEANVQTIGADASLLLPGQVLRIPTTSDA